MQPAISQVCSLNSPFDTDVEDYAAGACRAMEVWLGKLEAYLETHTVDDVQRLLAAHEMACPVASFQGGLLASQGDARRQHWEHFSRRLALCETMEIETLVIAGDLTEPLARQDLDRVQMSLVKAASEAAEHGLRVALEFQASASFANNVQTAAALVAEAGQPNLGLCLDVFHYYVGPSKPEDFQLLTGDNLFHVQVCDLLPAPRELAADADRILPGDGHIDLGPLIARLREIGYEGHVSVELMNPQIWQAPPRQFGEVAMTSLRMLLGQAR